MLVALCVAMFACERDEEFACGIVDMSADEVGTTAATLTAVVNCTDYGAVEAMGFMLSRSGSDDADWYPVSVGRSISLRVEGLRPATSYDYRVVVNSALGKLHESPQARTTTR